MPTKLFTTILDQAFELMNWKDKDERQIRKFENDMTLTRDDLVEAKEKVQKLLTARLVIVCVFGCLFVCCGFSCNCVCFYVFLWVFVCFVGFCGFLSIFWVFVAFRGLLWDL